jgi:hypothetical protein
LKWSLNQSYFSEHLNTGVQAYLLLKFPPLYFLAEFPHVPVFADGNRMGTCL